jgi:hypothetical protein
MNQPSLWSTQPQSLLPCPGNCAALDYARKHALASARRSHRAGADVDAPCSACGGRALAVVSCLAPLTLRSRGGIPYKSRWQPWEEHAAWRDGLLQEQVTGADWRRRWQFQPGWRVIHSRRA